MDTNLPTPDPDSEWATKRADQLHVGDYLSGDLLPLGQHSEVLFTRFFERDRSEWFFIAFVQWDGFHDSTTFLASAPVRVRIAEPTHVEDPTGLAYSRADDEPTTRLTVFASGMGGPDRDVVLTRPGRRVEPHTGALTEQGLVDETPAETVVRYFSFGHGQTDPLDSQDMDLVDHYVTVFAPTADACREAMLASRFGREWAFEYVPGTPQANEWIPRWTEYERIDAMPQADVTEVPGDECPSVWHVSDSAIEPGKCPSCGEAD